jgi:hypothetical protein
MRKNEENHVTIYSRGTLKIEGCTDSDRDCMKSDNRRYWIYKIIMAIASVIFALSMLANALHPYLTK